MSKRRQPVLSLSRLQDQATAAEEAISRLIREAQDLRIAEFKDSHELLIQFATEFRTTSKQFETTSRELAKRLTQLGSYHESNLAISVWNEKSEMISLIKSNSLEPIAAE